MIAETSEDLPDSLGITCQSLSKNLTKKKPAPKKIVARIDHGQKRNGGDEGEGLETYEGKDAALNVALSKNGMTVKSDQGEGERVILRRRLCG